MLRWSQKHPWLISLTVIVALLVLLFFGSLFIQLTGNLCEYSEQAHKTECANHHIGPFALLWIIEIIDSHNGFVTAIATLVMAGFTGTLWRATIEQGRLTERAIKVSEKQIALSEAQTDILAKQKEISRLQYFAEHRPRLILRDVFFSSPNNWDKLTFELSNIGGSEAKIIGGFIEIGFITDERQFKDTAGRDLGRTSGAVLGAGELRQFDKDVPTEIRDYCALEEGFYGRFPDARRIVTDDARSTPSGTLYFLGAVTYVDGRGEEFGITRLSVFRREWKSSGFERTENPDHEYAD
ncbi:MAG: hypothetical protein JSR55_06135 [Proteobacteria bacterium]|nr:hypothetical protein [Pseudomonadota bacterium]